MADIFETLRKHPYLKKHLGWKMALCQHMMYLLVDEDRGEPIIGERVPPWGAANAADYVKRVERNLLSLEKVPELSLSYQIAAVDMESIAREFPDVAGKMKRWFDKGRLDFVGGSFSQAHMQGVGSESNWRQFEFGTSVFKELFGKQIKLYARQETGLHQQIPQILKHFGFEMIVMPQFPWALELIEGPLELTSSHLGASFVRGCEFVNAVALDGTIIPTYLTPDVQSFKDSDPTHAQSVIPSQHGHNPYNVKRGISKDFYGPPPIWPYFPDLREVDREFYDKIDEFCELVLLEEALLARVKQAPPQARARVFSNWSYFEGVWAEELLRKNKRAEEHALLTESMLCMAQIHGNAADHADEIRNIWHTLLKYQHHDVLWIEVTDLRRKAINRLEEGIQLGKEIARQLAAGMLEQADDSLAVFNAVSRARRALIELPSGSGLEGAGSFQEVGARSIGFVDLPAGGFKSFSVSTNASKASPSTDVPDRICTEHYDVEFSPDGLMKQIVTARGDKLLEPQDYLGGEIRAMIDDRWCDNRRANCSCSEGELCYVLERSSQLADIAMLESYFFFKHDNVIKAEIEFDFNGDTIGYYWLDETKINVYYPTGGAESRHDIPFGYVEARKQRPLFATNWIHCGGLTYVNRGTVKHRIVDGVIANVIGWGGDTFGNRIHFDFWSTKQQYDIRLYGKQKVEYYLMPHGHFEGPQIVREVDDLVAPVFVTPGRGQHSFYEIGDPDLAVTAVYEKENAIWARGYQLPSQNNPAYRDFEIFNRPLIEL